MKAGRRSSAAGVEEGVAGATAVDISMFLADFGADVIKVELPRAGDEVRRWGEAKERAGSRLPFTAPRHIYRAGDGKCISVRQRSVDLRTHLPGPGDPRAAAGPRLADTGPRLGEHNREVLVDLLGFTEAQVAAQGIDLGAQRATTNR